MHSTLTPKTNAIMIGLWATTAGVLAVSTSPRPWILLAFGAALGLVAGGLQLAAMRKSSESLLTCRTALEVRAALSRSQVGKLYLYVFWGTGVLLFGSAFWLDREQLFVGWLVGYAAFAFARDCVTLRGTFELRQMAAHRV